MLCQTCNKQPTCTKLCDKAEKYVSQDYCRNRETYLPEEYLDLLSYHLKITPVNDVLAGLPSGTINFPFLSDIQNKCLELFYVEGKSYAEIAMLVNRRVRAVERQLSKARKEIAGFFYNSKGGLNGNEQNAR